LEPFKLRHTSPLKTKKADVAEHPEALDHVGLLVNGLPGFETGPPLT
jgi:hypothetical protein